MSNEWREHAACRGRGELFFPTSPNGGSEARAICNTECGVRLHCLHEAIRMRYPPQGIWGGSTERELARMRREHRQRARAL